jgi:isocitrate lyase
MLSTMLLIARTDSESAKLISSNVDASDHPFILGTTHASPDVMPLAEVLANAEASGRTGPEIDRLEAEWMAQHELCTFDQGAGSFLHFAPRSLTSHFRHSLAVVQAIELSSISDKSSALDQYQKACQGKSNAEARIAAHEILGEHVVWNWDRECSDFQYAYSHSTTFIVPRTREGYYHYQGGVDVNFYRGDTTTVRD